MSILIRFNINYIFFIISLFIFSFPKAQDNPTPIDKTIKIGLTHAPPLIILSQDKQPEGMIVDFLNEIALREKWKIVWITGNWIDVYEKAKNNELDLIEYIAFIEERLQYFNFSKQAFIKGWWKVYLYDYVK